MNERSGRIKENIFWIEEEEDYQPQAIARAFSQALLSTDACTLSLEKSIEDVMEKQKLPLVIGKTQVLNNRNYNTVKRNQAVGCRVKGQKEIEAVILISVSSPEIYLKLLSDLLEGGIPWTK